MTISEGDRLRFRIPKGETLGRMEGICAIQRFKKLKRRSGEMVYIDIHEYTFAHSPDKVNKPSDLDMRCGPREIEFAPVGAGDDAFVPYM